MTGWGGEGYIKILVIDDEESIVYLLKMNLILEGFDVEIAMNGQEGIDKFNKTNPDMTILDIMLPDMNGYEVLKRLQSINNEKPIIMLTAKDQLNDKLLGLYLGADDYMTKPFDSRELMLRIRAISRRIDKTKLENLFRNNIVEIIENDFIRILKPERKVFIDNEEIELTYKEFNTLVLMVENCNRVFTREILLEKVWGCNFLGNSRSVDIHIQRLRKKLKNHENAVKTIYGVGYKFEI
ncbi:MAG: two-component system alkaline phosphatase synthesis response regulator PhoP [Clostridium sp.]